MAREACIDVVSEAFEDEHHGTRIEHYCEAIGALVSSFSDKPELFRRIVEYVSFFIYLKMV
jgi:hypothetical protein